MRSKLSGISLLAAAGLLAACASQDTTATPTSPFGPLVPITEISEISCPEGVDFVLPQRIDIAFEPVDWLRDEEALPAEYFAPLTPRGIFHLTSSDPRFGGLSGIDFLDEDTAILVSDNGNLLWMDVSPETIAPTGTGFMTALRGSEGQSLDGRLFRDAEGIAWTEDALFVSFERGHRVLGYDIEACGAYARGALVIDYSRGRFGLNRTVGENESMEALAARGNAELIVGVESRSFAGASAGVFSGPRAPFNLTFPAPEITMLVGMDLVEVEDAPDRLYTLFRSYDPLRGNRIAIAVTPLKEDGSIGEMEQLTFIDNNAAVDNFEGITAQAINETTDRIMIISDNNFSDRQRTLLAIFDYEHHWEED